MYSSDERTGKESQVSNDFGESRTARWIWLRLTQELVKLLLWLDKAETHRFFPLDGVQVVPGSDLADLRLV